MTPYIEDFIDYISAVRRFSPRTREIYEDALERFAEYAGSGESDDELVNALNYQTIRSYEVYLMGKCGLKPKTACIHLSALRSFCRYLVNRGILKSNPAAQVTRPKTEKRLPKFFKEESIEEYFRKTECYASETYLDLYPEGDLSEDKHLAELYERRLGRAVIATLYSTAIRRAELINLKISSVDFSRRTLTVHGKGDKTREIPIIDGLLEEISLYLQSVSRYICAERAGDEPLFVTPKGRKLYPVYVDRLVKSELGDVEGLTQQRSPHVLRHTLATELLGNGSDINSIKEMLGHSSLAATQVYTHADIEMLKDAYKAAHPRAAKK